MRERIMASNLMGLAPLVEKITLVTAKVATMAKSQLISILPYENIVKDTTN